MSDYYGIRFTSPDSSSLNYVSVKFAKYSINCEENSTPILQNVSITNSEIGIRADHASPTIKKCNIFDNHTGIYCASCSGVVIDSCDIINNKFSSQLLTESGTEAIPFDGPPDTLPIFRTGVSLNGCDGISFTDNRVIDNYVGVSVGGSANGVFENNYVEANEWHGFDIAVRKSSQMQFIDNTFINNAKYPVNHGMDKTYYREFGGLTLGFARVHSGQTDILVKGNTFEDNTTHIWFCREKSISGAFIPTTPLSFILFKVQ